MTQPLQQVLFETDVIDPAMPGMHKRKFMSGQAYNLFLEGDSILIVAVQLGVTVRSNVRCSWIPFPEPLPTKVELQEKIDAAEKKLKGKRNA